MATEKPLVNKKYLLERYPGKGGWTYVVIPEISKDHRARFGWVQVKGTIDDYAIKNYKLMPMSNGYLFLPVKADIRKKIGKQAGDWVHIVLYKDDSEMEIPEALLLCLQDEPQTHQIFLSFTDGQRKEFIDWIAAAKTDTTKVERIAETLRKVSLGQTFREK
ncbi:MAG: YdeI/OmpD-associated family protein [Bacteroidota bacterium]